MAAACMPAGLMAPHPSFFRVNTEPSEARGWWQGPQWARGALRSALAFPLSSAQLGERWLWPPSVLVGGRGGLAATGAGAAEGILEAAAVLGVGFGA